MQGLLKSSMDFQKALNDTIWFYSNPWLVWANSPYTDLDARSPDTMPLSHYFEDQEIAVAKSGWDTLSTHFLMHCGPVGGPGIVNANGISNYQEYDSHCDPDANSFLIYSHGDWQAYEEDKLGQVPTRKRTETNNTIIIDDQGQYGDSLRFYWTAYQADAESLESVRLADFFDAGDIFYVRGDAHAAYNVGPHPVEANNAADPDRSISRFDRHVAYIRPDYFFILDDLRSDDSHKYSWVLNTSVRDTLETRRLGHYEVTKPASQSYTRTGEMDVWILEPDTSAIDVEFPAHWMMGDTLSREFLKVSNSTAAKDNQFLTFLETREATATPASASRMENRHRRRCRVKSGSTSPRR